MEPKSYVWVASTVEDETQAWYSDIRCWPEAGLSKLQPERLTGMKRKELLCCVFAAVLFSTQAHGESPLDWNEWRGPNGNSISYETGWNPAALVPEPTYAWRATVGFGYSAPSIKGDYLYTMGNVDGIDTVYCLLVADGREVWRHSYPCEPGSFAGPRATPVYSDDLVYTVSREGLLICFAAESGKVQWQKDLAKDANAVAPRWGISSSVVVRDNMLLLNVGKYGLAVDKRNGSVIWQSPKAVCGYASPVLYTLGGRDCLVAFGQKALYGVDLNSGELLWTQEWITRLDEQSADPVVWENHVFVSTIYSRGCAVFDISDNQPKEVWVNDALVNKFGSSVLYEGKLYGVHGNTIKRKGNSWDVGRQKGALCCVDFLTGELHWEEGVGIASLIIVDGKLIVLNERGRLFIAEATPESYKELASTQVLVRGDDAREAKGKCWTAPVFCRGMIYCRNDRGEIVCIDMRE